MKNNMSSEERELYNELKKLVNQANARIRNIEKETGIKEGFATKQLIDYLSSKPISAVTKSSRISLRKNYTLMQQQAIIKAIKEFKSSEVSTISGIKEYVKIYSKIANKKLSYKMADTWYKVTTNLKWLFDESLTESIFYRNYYPLVRTMVKEDWIDAVIAHKKDISDRNLRRNLDILYDYIRNG